MWRNVALGTIIVGLLDIAEVIVFYTFRGVKPIRILQSVAAGVTGRDRAFSGGTETAALGLFLHFCIAFVVVLTSLLIQGWTIAPAAKRLGVSFPRGKPLPRSYDQGFLYDFTEGAAFRVPLHRVWTPGDR